MKCCAIAALFCTRRGGSGTSQKFAYRDLTVAQTSWQRIAELPRYHGRNQQASEVQRVYGAS